MVRNNLLKNGIASFFEKGVKVLEQLLLVPFFISSWGAEYYGEWITLTIIPSIIAFSDLGFGSAAGNSFVLFYASQEFQKAVNINKAAMKLISTMIFSASLVSLLIMFILSYCFNVFEKSLIPKNDAIIAVSVLILARLLNFYSQLIESYFRAARRASFGINMLTLKSVLNLLAGMIVLLSGYGVIAFAISQLLVISIFTLAFYIIGKNILRDLFKSFNAKKDKNDFKMIINKGFGYLMSPIWQAIFFQGTTFVVRIVLGPSAVAIFNTVRTLSRSVNQLFTLVNNSVFPELQFEMGSGNYQKAKKLYRGSVLIVFCIAIIGCFILALFGQWFYEIWTKNELNLPPAMWYIFILGILFNAIWWTSGVVFRAVNKPYHLSSMGVIAALISVAASYFLTQKYDLVGAALGSFFLEFIMAIYILPMSLKTMDISWKDFIFEGKDDFFRLYMQIKSKLVK